jgi:molecular chaperone GrpE
MAKKNKKEKAEDLQEEVNNEQVVDEQEENAEKVELDPQQELEIQVKEANEKYVRLYSDFDNFRKRTIKEKSELIQNASERVIIELLPILDDFERALANNDDPELVEGIKLISSKMLGIFEKQGLKKMVSKGEKFDMDLHEAITEIPAPEEKLKGCVVDTVEEGYYLNDKVIRFAKVVVGK